MATTWGGITLHAQEFVRRGAEISLSERKLLPKPGDVEPQSVLMGTGRSRRRYELRGWVTAADFEILNDKYEAGESNPITFPDGTGRVCLIESLSGELRRGTTSRRWVSMVFLEVGEIPAPPPEGGGGA